VGTGAYASVFPTVGREGGREGGREEGRDEGREEGREGGREEGREGVVFCHFLLLNGQCLVCEYHPILVRERVREGRNEEGGKGGKERGGKGGESKLHVYTIASSLLFALFLSLPFPLTSIISTVHSSRLAKQSSFSRVVNGREGGRRGGGGWRRGASAFGTGACLLVSPEARREGGGEGGREEGSV